MNILGTHDDPLFQANQIAKILEIKNIRDAIKDFNEDERVPLVLTPLAESKNVYL